jgi:hypothetical protein
MTGLLKLSQVSVDNFVDRSCFVAGSPYESRAWLACTEKQQIPKVQLNQQLRDLSRSAAEIGGTLAGQNPVPRFVCITGAAQTLFL